LPDPASSSAATPTAWLRKTLNVERAELPAVIGGVAMFFLLFTAYALLRPVRETMGIAGGIRNLQWLFTATFIAALLTQVLFGWLASRVSRRRILPWVYGFFVVNLLLFVALLSVAPGNVWTARTFYVWLSVFNLLAISLAWSLHNDILSAEQSKRLFAIIASGSSAGSIVGPILTATLVGWLGPAGLMLISASLLAASAVIAVALHRWRDRHPLAETHSDAGERSRPLGGNPFSGMRDAFRSPYLLGISIFVVLAASASTFLYFELMRAVSLDFPDPAQQTRIFSFIDLFVNSCTIVLQIFATGRIAQRFGVGVLLAAVPAIIALGFLCMAFAPLFIVVASVTVIRRIGQYAMVRPGREMLYSVLTADEKYKAKNFIDTVLYRGGDAVSAWLKRMLDVLGGHSMPAMLAGALLAAIWALVGLLLARAQQKRTPAAAVD